MSDLVTLGLIGYVFSVAFLCWSSLRVAVQVSEGPSQFWVSIVVGYVQLTTISLGISAFQMLRWEPFLTIQFIVVALVWSFTDTSIKREISGIFDRIQRITRYSSVYSRLLFGIIILIISFSFIMRAVIPITTGDGLAYIAPRVAFWLQQSHVGFHTTFVDRQLATSFGGDYFLLWGIIFTKQEIIGRITHWIAYPLATVGIYILLQSMDFDTETMLISTSFFVSTPIVFWFTSYQQPFIWLILFSLGAGYWVFQQSENAVILLGIFTGFAISAKQQAFSLISSSLLVSSIWGYRARRMKLAGMFIISVLLILFATAYVFLPLRNIFKYGTLIHLKITGRAGSEFGIRILYVKFVRLWFMLLRFPVPVEAINEAVAGFGQSLLEWLGAATHISEPRDKTWSF